MKHLFLFLALMVFTILSYGQQVQSDTIPIDNISITEAERIIDKYSNQLIVGFNNMIQSVTPIAQNGFEIVIRKNIAQGIIGILPLLTFVIFLFLLVKEYTRIENLLKLPNPPMNMDVDRGPLDEDNITLPLILYLIITIAFLIVTLSTIYGSISRLIVPEWYAIKDIIQLLQY